MVNLLRQQKKEIQEAKESQGKVSESGGGTDIIVDGIRAFIIHHESKGQRKKEFQDRPDWQNLHVTFWCLMGVRLYKFILFMYR
jgi:hypothetical protein